MKTDNIFY